MYALASNSITDNTPIQDQLRIFLGQFGVKDVPITIDEISSSLGLTYPQVYQGIKRLQDRGEIDLEKETLPNRAERIVGIKLIKLEPSSRTYKRASDRSKRLVMFPRVPTPEADPAFPKIMDYLNKKLTVEKLREDAINGGLDRDIIQFDADEIAEEALALLQIVSDQRAELERLNREKQLLEFDLQAERQNALSYKNRLREETQEELREFARTGG